MPRIARVVAVGLPHHITQRGNYQQDVFLEASDRHKYLNWIGEYSLEYGLSILAYCLMQNHVHFIAIPEKEDSLANVFNTTHMRYSQYFNKKLNRRGHLWQGRFYSCVLDEPHLILAVRYAERNPVRAGLVENPWQWPWSSAIAHSKGQKDSLVNPGDLLNIIGMSNESWKKYIDLGEEKNLLQDIRKYTLAGRPLGTTIFVETLEKKFGRELCVPQMGRPKKA